nr:PREDICTED: putative fidgetin-like protein 2 [Lepisosteus oculatus]
MLSPIVPYSLLKMHWTPEHAQPLTQWPEQHLDVSSTTSSPAHKSELYAAGRQRYNYAWANDDISALTASNLLKRYAEKYSGMLDSPYDRAPVPGYPEPGPFGGLNGQKSDAEPWPMSHGSDGGYSLAPPPPGHEVLAGSKGAVTSGVPSGPSGVSISDPGYSAGGSCSGPPSQEYPPPAYNGTYLSSGYCSQPGSALPPASLLQPPSTLVPSYTPPSTVYSYPPSSYPPQPGLAPAYAGVHSPASYLPSGLAAPTPLPPPRPAMVGGSYGYQGHGLAGGPEPGGALKRKAFELGVEEEGEEGPRYRKYGYEHAKPGAGSPYSVPPDKGECRGNGFSASSAPDPQSSAGYKPGKPPSQPGLGADEVGKYGGLKPLVSPPYSAAGEYSPPAALGRENGSGAEHGFAHARLAAKLPSEELLKAADPRALELKQKEQCPRAASTRGACKKQAGAEAGRTEVSVPQHATA